MQKTKLFYIFVFIHFILATDTDKAWESNYAN